MIRGSVGKPPRMSVRRQDTVEVISGKDRGKRGEVLRVERERARLVVSGVNIAHKHQKPTARVMQSGIIEQENPIAVSNVMVVCRHCKKPTRVGHMMQDGRRARRCVRCGQAL